MKIIHVVPYIKNLSAGTTYAVVSLCEALSKLGCEVILYTLSPVPIKKYNFEVKSFEPSKFPHPALGRSKQMLKALLKDCEDVDIIHSHMLWMSPSYYAGIASKSANKPYVCSPHGSLSKWVLNRSKWKKVISLFLGQKLALDNTDCFHITAKHEKNEIIEANYFKQKLIDDARNKQFILIPNGIDIPLKREKIINKKRKILFMSRLHPKKGLELLIEAWGNIHINHPNTALQIVGPIDDQNYINRLKTLIDKNKIKRINWLGEIFSQEKFDLFFNADLFVFPTYSENFGLVVAEALASGTPVICSKGAPWSGLIKNDAGWWVDIGVKPIQEAITNALSLPPQDLIEKGERGRQWMIQEYSWDNVALEFMEAYRNIKK